MKKQLFALLLLAVNSLSLFSQNCNIAKTEIFKNARSENGISAFKKGQVDLNLGFGLGRNRYYYGSIYTRATPPISTSLDLAVSNNISVGLFFAFTRTRWTTNGSFINNGVPYNYNDTYTWYYYTLGGRVAYHLGDLIELKELDVYIGLMLGNNFMKFKYRTDNNSGGRTYSNNLGTSRMYVSFYAGARYMLTEKFGIFGEFGYGLTYGNLGFNFKLN